MTCKNVNGIDQRLRDSVEALREVSTLIALSGDSILIKLHDIALTAALSALTRSQRSDHSMEEDGQKLH
jgi:hypothetical protein